MAPSMLYFLLLAVLEMPIRFWVRFYYFWNKTQKFFFHLCVTHIYFVPFSGVISAEGFYSTYFYLMLPQNTGQVHKESTGHTHLNFQTWDRPALLYSWIIRCSFSAELVAFSLNSLFSFPSRCFQPVEGLEPLTSWLQTHFLPWPFPNL